ncbi:high mobility group nucleosome-binding domain-containing protein 5-like protein [Cinnamomum micranthum f. kanehirae]|uniref:High mobility group nucleosome-binding domain-containing protein 5-like protein n=1 Tax=Cinnamomum micranthum f. kanehirae TaxID=337451 RepID=A0A3S3MXG1_9MAGN|nr:high mobility group nucleosome-binding domain-containing protein 5-like protein [Cinnamomum micranthum f. kanehirae]
MKGELHNQSLQLEIRRIQNKSYPALFTTTTSKNVHATISLQFYVDLFPTRYQSIPSHFNIFTSRRKNQSSSPLSSKLFQSLKHAKKAGCFLVLINEQTAFLFAWLQKDNKTPLDKSTPRYLKPITSSTNEPNKLRKKPPSITVTANSLTRKKSLEKPPSPTPSQRTPTLSSPRERLLKPTSPSPKTAISPKPVSDKIPKTLRNGRVQQPPLKPTKTIKRETSLKKRETKASPTATANAANGHHVARKLASLPDKQEDREADEITLDMFTSDGEEQYINEIQPIDYVDVDLYISDSSNRFEASETSSLAEELSDFAAVEEEGNKTNEEKEPRENPECEDGKIKQQLEDNPDVTDTPEQINVEKKEEHKTKIAEKESLEFKERDVGIIEDPKRETEEKKPRRQGSHGRRESQVYNDVIEETASKLVEERKSRVKALVGAFETVISFEGQGGP